MYSLISVFFPEIVHGDSHVDSYVYSLCKVHRQVSCRFFNDLVRSKEIPFILASVLMRAINSACVRVGINLFAAERIIFWNRSIWIHIKNSVSKQGDSCQINDISNIYLNSSILHSRIIIYRVVKFKYYLKLSNQMLKLSDILHLPIPKREHFAERFTLFQGLFIIYSSIFLG